jgi:hypothetical protein
MGPAIGVAVAIGTSGPVAGEELPAADTMPKVAEVEVALNCPMSRREPLTATGLAPAVKVIPCEAKTAGSTKGGSIGVEP